MYRSTLLIFSFAVLSVLSVLWGAELVFPKSAASAVVLVSVTALGLWIVRPGWHLKPRRFDRYWLMLFGLLLASAAVAGWFLSYFKVPLPYDFSKLSLLSAMPAILAITGIEELLFRQVMYRWLEKKGVSAQTLMALG